MLKSPFLLWVLIPYHCEVKFWCCSIYILKFVLLCYLWFKGILWGRGEECNYPLELPRTTSNRLCIINTNSLSFFIWILNWVWWHFHGCYGFIYNNSDLDFYIKWKSCIWNLVLKLFKNVYSITKLREICKYSHNLLKNKMNI